MTEKQHLLKRPLESGMLVNKSCFSLSLNFSEPVPKLCPVENEKSMIVANKQKIKTRLQFKTNESNKTQLWEWES